MRYRSPMARPSGSARILLSVKSCDTSLMICLINKLDSGVKEKTDEFKKKVSNIFGFIVLIFRRMKGLLDGSFYSYHWLLFRNWL